MRVDTTENQPINKEGKQEKKFWFIFFTSTNKTDQLVPVINLVNRPVKQPCINHHAHFADYIKQQLTHSSISQPINLPINKIL